MSLSLDDAAAQIAAVARPILLIDTCSLLDVIRAPIRRDSGDDLVHEAARLVKESGTRAWVVLTELVMQEFAENVEKVTQEVEAVIKRLDQQNARLVAACQAIDPVAKIVEPQEFSELRLPRRLGTLIQSFFPTAVIIASDAECNQRAFERVVRRIPPAAKGQQVKDCAVVEHYLALCARVRGRGFTERAVLVSSNKSDYCGEDSKLAAALVVDFGAVGLEYAGDLCWARAFLG